MATSSIIENIRVNNPKALEEYVEFMEASAKEPVIPRTDEQRSGVISDSSVIRKFATGALDKKGIKL